MIVIQHQIELVDKRGRCVGDGGENCFQNVDGKKCPFGNGMGAEKQKKNQKVRLEGEGMGH